MKTLSWNETKFRNKFSVSAQNGDGQSSFSEIVISSPHVASLYFYSSVVAVFAIYSANNSDEKRQPDGCLDDGGCMYWLLLGLFAGDGAVADVIPVEHAIPADLLSQLIGLLLGFQYGMAERGST